MTDHRDLALADATLEALHVEELYVQALSEAVTYRLMLQMALTQWERDKARLRAATRTIRQCVGVDPWSHDDDAETE